MRQTDVRLSRPHITPLTDATDACQSSQKVGFAEPPKSSCLPVRKMIVILGLAPTIVQKMSSVSAFQLNGQVLARGRYVGGTPRGQEVLCHS